MIANECRAPENIGLDTKITFLVLLEENLEYTLELRTAILKMAVKWVLRFSGDANHDIPTS